MASRQNNSGEVAPTALWFAALTLISRTERLFVSNWSKAARDLDQETIHDLRVASRRLREALELFSPALPAKKVARIARQAKRVTRMLGELRNADEAFLFFSTLPPEDRTLCQAEVDHLLVTLGSERKRAREKKGKSPKGWGRKPLLKRLRALRKRPNLFKRREADPFQQFSTFAVKALMERAATVAALLPEAVRHESAEAQHALRIAVKKMRYRLEAMEPLLPLDSPRLREALKNYQDVLGQQHDIDVFSEIVRERVHEGPGREALLLVLARRRGELFARFLEMTDRLPLTPLAEEASATLQQRGSPPGQSPAR